jgi:ligand-binding SRPBCC domain-containing protein
VPTIEESVSINVPPAKVFAFMSNANNAVVYDSSITRSQQEGEGELAVGTRWRGASKVLGREFDWVAECTELEQDRRFASTSVEGKLPFAIRTDFVPEGEGTRLTYTLTADSGLGGVFGKLAEPLVVKAQTRTVRANLATIKELLENDAV